MSTQEPTIIVVSRDGEMVIIRLSVAIQLDLVNGQVLSDTELARAVMANIRYGIESIENYYAKNN